MDRSEDFSRGDRRYLQEDLGCCLRSIDVSGDKYGGRNPAVERDLLAVMDPAAELKLLFLSIALYGSSSLRLPFLAGFYV